MSENKSIARAVAYYRMSSSKQEASIPEQREWAQDAAKARELTIVSEFQDEAIPGSEVEGREGLFDMIRYCEDRGNVQAIVVWDQDRFSRASSIRTAAVLDRLMCAGVTRILTPERWFDLEEEVDLLLLNIGQDFRCAAQSKSISKNVSRDALHRARAGKWVAGKPPLGYRIGPTGKLIFGPEAEVAQVRWMFMQYTTSGDSLADIAGKLNAMPGALRPRSGLWRSDSVRRVLVNRAYVGDIEWNKTHQGKYHRISGGKPKKVKGQRGERVSQRNGAADRIIVENNHPAIIKREEFRQARDKMIANAWKPGRSVPHHQGEWALSGLVRCGDCGGTMQGHREEHRRPKGRTYTYRRYYCAANTRHGKGTCRMCSVREAEVMAALAAEVHEMCLRPERFTELVEEIKAEASAVNTDTEARIHALDDRLAELNRDIRQGNINLARLPADRLDGVIAAVRSWEEERDTLTAERAELASAAKVRAAEADQLAGALEEFHRLDELLTETPDDGEQRLTKPREIRDALADLITRVTIHFDHSRPKNQSRARSIEVEWVFDLPAQSSSGATRRC
jgi:DNA invertase Pin-like site-specific DNA recombinase